MQNKLVKKLSFIILSQQCEAIYVMKTEQFTEKLGNNFHFKTVINLLFCENLINVPNKPP